MFKKIIRAITRAWRLKTQKEWPQGCGYQGYEFGGGYLDSQCFGGRLFDMDNYDDGTLYEPMEDIPCPGCRRNDAIVYWAERGAEYDDMPTAEEFSRAVGLVDDIRKNRGLKIPDAIDAATHSPATVFEGEINYGRKNQETY